MTRKRIALLLPTLEGGGAERVMITIAHALLARGYAVDLVLVTASGPYIKDLDPAIRLVDLGAKRALLSFGPLVRYLRREKPSSMLSTLAQANFIAVPARAAVARHTRLVVREANTLSSWRLLATSTNDRILVRLLPRVYRKADAVVAPSQGVADDLAKLMGSKRPPIVMIPNPIDRRAIRERAKEPNAHRWCAEGSDPLVLAVGRLNAQKDVHLLIHAFERVVQKRPANLLVLGDGSERGALEALVEAKGLRGRVEMPGFVENPFKFMSRASVYVLSSRYEGLPNALLQAIAAGAPVVATDCPSGPREILDGGRWGRLVPVGDAQAMADAIVAVVDGHGARMPDDVFDARYGVDRCVDQYLDVLACGAPLGSGAAG